jgi:signal recognition particle receptor subunit beta
MASINYAHKEIISKIVYYGPGLSGKTTNLQLVFQKIPSETRGELISLATDADRTLYFDFLPVNVGTIQGFATKFQLYTVPGQVYYNATRKLVLRGVDGIVFVADSQHEKMDENIESLQNLRDNLEEYGYNIDEIPMAIQYNKRDLPNAVPIEELQAKLNPGNLPYFEAVASKGEGVFKTLKAISKLVLEQIRTSKMGSPKKVQASPKPEPKLEPVAVGAGPATNPVQAVAPAPAPVVEPVQASPAPAAVAEPEVVAPEPVAVAEPEVAVLEPVAVAEPEVVVLEPVAVAEPEVIAPETVEKPEPEIRQESQGIVETELDTAVEDDVKEDDKDENVPGIMKDEETIANVVVSDTQGLPEPVEEEAQKDDLEETTERSILKEETVLENGATPKETEEPQLSVTDNHPENVIEPTYEDKPEKPAAVAKETDEQDGFNEDSTQVSDFTLKNPLPLGKPQMAESRKVKEKRRFPFFGLFRKKK